ncbi:hypothetical protein [Bacillus suaedaesalsae]|uniref:Small, acid-soluble spore protein K n=1 Tax=Bacillus suaedaesalsae TaxID=2810349 RepID=A0ABS2DI93_9BACI|nr:hypothetical protein [Bacillus suaedaesalsae]MBM6617248.1 hypothetical protein [Bacillus suaedaesalsae]
MNDINKVTETNNKITQKGKVHSESNNFDSEANAANSKINDAFYHNERENPGISPALILNNVPLIETDK